MRPARCLRPPWSCLELGSTQSVWLGCQLQAHVFLQPCLLTHTLSVYPQRAFSHLLKSCVAAEQQHPSRTGDVWARKDKTQL